MLPYWYNDPLPVCHGRLPEPCWYAYSQECKGWKDRSRDGTETKQQNRNHSPVDTHRSGVLSCRPLTTSEGKSRMRARHTRGQRRPLGPEGLATLALRKLNRQPTGVLALNYTTFRLHHHHGVRTIVKPVCKKRQV